MKLNISIYFFLCFLLSSCFVLNHKFKITSTYIKSNRTFYQGFQFSNLKIDSLDSLGLPAKYQKISTANLYIVDDSDSNKSKKIYFNKPNSNYLWHYNEEWGMQILPIKIKSDNWYLIEGLVFWGNPTLSKFIYIDDKGDCNSYTVPHVSNW